MITLHDILKMVDRNDYTLSEEANVQIMDYFTTAIFRRNYEKQVITLGGSFYCYSFMQLLNLPVQCIDVGRYGELIIYISAT